MDIFYFNTQGEKIGPITREGLVRLAEAGVVSQTTIFEINGQKVKGKHIKNLRPIFEKRKAEGAEPPLPEEPKKEIPSVPSAAASGQNDDFGGAGGSMSEDIYSTAAEDSESGGAAKAAYHYRSQRARENSTPFGTHNDESSRKSGFFGRIKKSLSSGETKEPPEGFKRNLFAKLRPKKRDAETSGNTAGSRNARTNERPLARRKDKAANYSNDLVFTKFWRGYKLFTIFLHIFFILATLFCLLGLYRGTKMKLVGTLGYSSLNRTLKDLLQTHKYEEFANEVDRIVDKRPFRFIQRDLDKWFDPKSFQERTETLLSGENNNKILRFEEMVANLKKVTDATYEDEVLHVRKAVEAHRDEISRLRTQIRDLKEEMNARDRKNDFFQNDDTPSSSKPDIKLPKVSVGDPKEKTDPLLERIKELEEQLRREEEKLKKEEEQLRELESVTNLADKGKVIDTLAPERSRPYEEKTEELEVSPQNVEDLIDYVHGYMKVMARLFDDIHETGVGTYRLYKTRAIEIVAAYLALLFMCYFIATRVRMAEETQITRMLLEEKFAPEDSSDQS